MKNAAWFLSPLIKMLFLFPARLGWVGSYNSRLRSVSPPPAASERQEKTGSLINLVKSLEERERDLLQNFPDAMTASLVILPLLTLNY